RADTASAAHPCPTRRSSDLARDASADVLAAFFDDRGLEALGEVVLADGPRQVARKAWLVADGEVLRAALGCRELGVALAGVAGRSEEHTSELQSRENLVCRL